MTENKQIYIFGASGHGKIAHAICQATGWKVLAFFDANPALTGSLFCGVPVLAQDTASEILGNQRVAAHVAVGSNSVRQKLAGLYGRLAEWPVLVHPAAVVDPAAKIGAGSLVGAMAVVQVDAVIGQHCIINTGAVVEHDCVIADYVHIAPTAALCGAVTIGQKGFVGVGAKLIPCMDIGEGATVGAGAVVVNPVPAGQIWVGSPARPIVRSVSGSKTAQG